jgi:hypothetical protein
VKASAKFTILLSVAALILCSACGSSLKTKLVGKWNNAAAKTVWEIKSDGTVRVVSKDPNGQEKVLGSGTFRVIDAETVELNWGQRTDKANVQSGPQGVLKFSASGVPPFELTPTS